MAVLQSDHAIGVQTSGAVPAVATEAGDAAAAAEEEEVIVPPWYRQLLDIKMTFIVILIPIVLIPIPLFFTSSVGRFTRNFNILVHLRAEIM